MSTGDDDLSSGINGRLRPRKSYVSSPQTTKTTRRLESKLSHEKAKRVSTQSKNPLTKSDDLSKKSDFSSVLEYLCPYCDKNFVSKQTASKHTRRIHFLTSKQGDKGVINCLYCNHSDPEHNNIFKHMIDSHPNQYFACLDCHTRFLSTSELAEHKLNVCERQKLHYKSKLPQKSNRASKKSRKLDRQVVIRNEERHGYKSIVISCELKPTHVTDAADIEDNITTNLILPSINQANNIIDKNAVILLDDLQWKKRIPQNFSFHNTDTDQILSRLGVVHRSPRTGESTRKDWFKVIDDATQKFERCFDTNFYSKVASNVQENLSKFLDGSFNFNPDPNHTIKPRKAKNSVPINTVEGFPILLSCEQYSRNIFDVYMPRAIAPKHKWKWDNLENDRSTFNADQIKRDSHVNNCIVTLVSSLDIWTQLCMRHKFEEKFKTTPFEKKTEKKKIISNELKEILESRQLPPSTARVSRNCTALVKVPNNLDFPTSLGLTPSTSKYEIQPAVLSGEWVRPRCYVCCACGAQTRDPRTLSTHILTEHPNAQVQHYEIPGELLLNADILRHLYVPPSPVQNRTRPPRGFRECTKCNKSITIEDLHQHMLDCAGDMPTVRRKCRYRHFGVRKRRTRIQDSRIRKKIRKDIHRQNGRPRAKIRSEVGDAETIRKMIADLPAKRHRVTPTGSNLRPKKKINPQLDQLTFSKRHTEDNKNRRFNTDSSTNTTFQGDGEPNNFKESKIMKNKLTRRSTVIINKKTNKTHRNDVNIRYDSRIEAVSNQLSLSSDSIASSAGSKTQVLSLQNQPNRINVNSGPYNTREQANGSNNDGSNNRENQNPERNDNDGNFNDQGAPPQNIPLKHSIARLTADSDTHDKAVQFHHLFLLQQECNNVTQHDPSGQPVFFEDKAVTDKLDKPPLETKEKGEDLDTLNNHKNKLNKQRKGLNDCIAMLKNKLVEPSKSPEVSIQCKIDETPNTPPKRVITNRNDITVQCPDDNQAPETVITPRSRNVLNKGNITENNVKSASRIASTKQKSESVTTHKVSLSINMENKHHDNPASVGISGTSELRDCERNNYLPVFKKTGIPPKYNQSEINANASESVHNTQKIDNFVRPSVTPNRQATHINVTAKGSKNILTVINKESSSLDRSVMQVLESSHKEAHNGHEKINESINKNKLYVPEKIPPAHCIVDAESISTAPLDLSGKLYVNEVIAHSSKQDISYNSSAHVYETLDLSNKGINKVFQKGDINELSNDEVVVDLRVKPAIPSTSTASFNYSEDISYDDMTATDLSVRHTEFMPTDLSVKGKGKTGNINTMTRKDLSVMRPTSNFTLSQNDIIGLNLSPNEFPTDLSRTCLEVLSSKQVIGQDANNTTSSLDICDYDNTNSADFPYGQDINKHIITTGKNITSHPITLQYNTNGNSYKIQSRQMTIPSEVHIEDERFSANEFSQSRKVQYNLVDVSTMSGSSTVLDKAPMNLCNPLIKVSNCDSLHKKTHIASQECVKTLDILNMPLNPNNTSNLKTILRPSVSITPNYINVTELAKSVKQADKQNASDLSLQPSKSKRSQENLTKRNYELNERNSCPIDNDPETAKKIALLPKELVDILGNMPVDHRNQLLNVLPQYVSVSTSAAPIRHDAFNDPKLSSNQQHSQPCNETDNTEIPQHSGMSKSQHSLVDRYQVPHPYYQPQGETTKSEGEYGQFHGSIEDTNTSCLNDNKRRSIDLSICGIIDLTNDNVDTISCSTSPVKENKTESPIVKAFGFKTNNEKTASLRAVRIKAPSERAKSIILETELKRIIPEKKYIDSHSSDSGNNDISPVVQIFETSVTKATNVHAVSVVDAISSEQIDTPLTLNRSELLDGHNEPRKERTTTNVLSNVTLQSLQTDMATFNSESVGKNSVNISDSESPLQNDSLERRVNSQEVEKILESFDEDDSEDDVSLAVIVKQKQRKLGILETCSNNVNSTNKNESITNYSKEVMDSLDITPELKEHRAGAIFDKTDKNNYEEKDLDIAITSKHKETSYKISAKPLEGRYKSEKYFSPIKLIKYSRINFDKALPSNNESNVPLNEKYSEAVQTRSGDQDPHRLSSNNNTIANEIEVNSNKNMISLHTQSASLIKPFYRKKEKKENPYKKIAESEIRLEKESLITPFRRSRRGKSLLFDNNGDSCNFHNIGDVAEQRGPYTKKQLIFSKMLQDEENTVAKVPDSDDLHLDKHVENMPLRPREADFTEKRKKSTHKRKKLTKLNEMALANPISLNKTIEEASNKVESTVLVPDKDEVCKIQYQVNNSECDKSDIFALSRIKRIVLPIKSENIAGKRKSSSSIISKLVFSAKERKLKTKNENLFDEEDNAVGRNCDNNTKNVNTNDNAHIRSAVGRCRTKSVVSQSTSEMYYTYENISETKLNYKGQSEYKPTNQNIVNKTSNNDDVEFVNSTTTSILNTDIEGYCKEKQEQEEEATTWQVTETKALLSYPDESSIRDEPLKTPPEMIKKNSKKNQEKSNNEPCETSSKTHIKPLSVTLEGHGTKNTEIQVDADKLDKEKHKESSGSSSIEFDYIVELLYEGEKDDKRKHLIQEKEKPNKLKPLVDNQSLQNENTNQARTIFKTSSIIDAGEVHDHENVGNVGVDPYQMPDKEVDSTSERRPKITGKRKSISSNNNQPIFSSAIAKKIKTTMNDDNININNCYSSTKYASTVLEKSVSDTNNYDCIKDKTAVTPAVLKRKSFDEDASEKSNCHRKVVSYDEHGKPTEWNNTPSLSTSFSCMDIDVAAGDGSESKFLFSDSDESSKSDEPLTKYIEEKEKKSQMKHPEQNKNGTDNKWVFVCVDKHDAKTNEFKSANNDQLDKEKIEEINTSPNLDFDCLVKMTHNREKTDNGHNSSKPLFNSQEPEKQGAATRQISEVQTFLSDSDESSKSDEPLKKSAEKKKRKKTQSNHPENSNQKPCETSAETHKNKKTLSVSLEKQETKEATTEELSKENENGSSTASTLEFDFLVELFYKREKKDKKHSSRIYKEKKKKSNVDNLSLRNETTQEANNKVEHNENPDCDDIGLRQICSVSDVDVPIKITDNSSLPTKNTKEVSTIDKLACTILDACKIEYNENSVCDNIGLGQTSNASDVDIKRKDNPSLRTISTKEASNKDKTSLTILDECKVVYNENLDCDNLGARQICSSSHVDVPIKVVENTKLNTTRSKNELRQSFEEKSNINSEKIDGHNSDEIVRQSENSKNISTTVSLKHGKKPVMRRCRSKSLLVKSTSGTYDPYDINLLDTDTDADPFSNRESLSNSAVSKKTSKTSIDRDTVVKTVDSSTPSSNISHSECNDLNKNEKQDSLNHQTAKELPCDSDESSKSDEPLTKYIEEKGKKTSEKNELPHKALLKRKKKTLSVTSEKPDPDNGHDDNEERIRSEQFMESFGFFSERKPRKSNLLATKKISETYNLINSFREPEDKSNKKNVHSENRKTADDEDVTRTVRQQQLAHRGLSRDEALFLDCCELLNASHNDDGPAQHIMESEEVRNLENDLISGLKEAAASASNFKAKPITTCTPEEGVDTKQVNSIEHPKDVNIIKQSEEIKSKKAYEVKEKMYPDVIEDIDMFEDKFDKIKRKCRSQAAKQTKYVETSISSKSRKKVEKKKRKKSLKKNSTHGAVPTKGALKGFEGVKVSILTSDINMASILPPLSTPAKKKKRNNKRKKERKHSENLKSDSDQKRKDTQKKVDVYEFMDSEEAEPFEFRPSTLMERFKTIKDVKPSTSKSQSIDFDPEATTESASDGDDFVYMSDDYICSDAETENSLMSCELGNTKNSSEFKKSVSTPKRKDTTEKSAVMGKIFKHNAVRAEKKIAKTKEPIKPKANLDQLFDSLLEEPKSPITSSPKKEDLYNLESSFSHNSEISKRGSMSVKCHEDDGLDDSDSSKKRERSPTPVSFTSLTSLRKRRGSQNSSSKEKEFSTDKEDENLASCSPSTSKDKNKLSFKHTSRKKKEALYENYDDKSFKYETKRVDSLFGVDESSTDDNDSLTDDNRHKSKEKKIRMKSTDTDIENNSFDYTEEAINTYDDTGVARQRARRKCTVGKQNVLAETWSSESEPDGIPPRPNSADSVVAGTSRKKKNRKKDGHALGIRKRGNRQQVSAKREAHCSNRSNRISSESISRVVPTTRPSAVCSSSTKARTRPSPYYWSDEQEPEHVQQHGWIVGDSHKKLVTMLAHAKGKRNNDHKRNLVE